MGESAYIGDLIRDRQHVMIRLAEGRDIYGRILSQDTESVLVQRYHSLDHSIIYKRAISVITPIKEQENTDDDTKDAPCPGN